MSLGVVMETTFFSIYIASINIPSYGMHGLWGIMLQYHFEFN